MVGMVEDTQAVVPCRHHKDQWASSGLEMLVCDVMS